MQRALLCQSCMYRVLFMIGILLLLLQQVSKCKAMHACICIPQKVITNLFYVQKCAVADYELQLSIHNFSNPSNRDAAGICCNDTEGTSNCITSCDVTVFVCIRPSEYESSNTRDCPILGVDTGVGVSANYTITGAWLVSVL